MMATRGRRFSRRAPRCFAYVLAAASLAGAQGARAESSGEILRTAVGQVPNDFRDLTLAPFRYPEKTLVVLGATLGLVLVDKPTTRFVQAVIEPVTDFEVPTLINTPMTRGMDGVVVSTVALWYLGSLTAGHEPGQVAAVLATKAYVYSLVYSQLFLKTITGRTRPAEDLNAPGAAPAPYTKSPLEWGHWRGPTLRSRSEGSSMPSFHFTFYVAAAQSFRRVYDDPWVPYSLCAAALAVNFKSHRHWVSDMAVGAFMGYSIGNVVADNYFAEIERKKSAAPSSTPPAEKSTSTQKSEKRWHFFPVATDDGAYRLAAFHQW